jgi:hypothetical protein
VYFADDGGKSLFFVPVSFWFDSIRRLSSGVEHFHGKEGVSGSNPEGGSSSFLEKAKFIPIPNYKNAY